VLIDVATDQGITGRSYLFAYSRVALAPLARLVADIGAECVGKPVAPVALMEAFDRRFRLLGWQGLVGMAVSGLDMAFWDVLGRADGCSLAQRLGGLPVALPAYDSFGLIDPRQDEAALLASVDAGFRAVKIKLGEGDLARDVEVVRAVRAIIGPQIRLMVDYNQALTPADAIRRIARLSAFDLDWVEEPVRAEDAPGHAQVRARSPVPIQTGENWWFPQAMAGFIRAGASDCAMLDVMKIGGVTGWLRAAALAEAAGLPLSSHIFPEVSAHLLAVTPTAEWLEHLDLAGHLLLDPLRPDRGTVTARGPGLGLDWDEAAVGHCLV
jgi:mandelate racemase